MEETLLPFTIHHLLFTQINLPAEIRTGSLSLLLNFWIARRPRCRRVRLALGTSLNLFLLLQISFVVVPRDHYFSEVIASGFCRYLRHPTVDDYLQRVNVRFGKLYAEALRGREIPCLLSV